jgi:hypothetical protein
VQGNGMAQTIINMLNVNKEDFRSLQRSEMKQIIGGADASGCPTAPCLFIAPNDDVLQGTCVSSPSGSCYCTNASTGLSDKGCSDTTFFPVIDPIGEGVSL